MLRGYLAQHHNKDKREKCDVAKVGALQGRVLDEALPGGAKPTVDNWVERAKPGADGLATVLIGQRVGTTRYFDAAGFPGRSVGVDERKAAAR